MSNQNGKKHSSVKNIAKNLDKPLEPEKEPQTPKVSFNAKNFSQMTNMGFPAPKITEPISLSLKIFFMKKLNFQTNL